MLVEVVHGVPASDLRGGGAAAIGGSECGSGSSTPACLLLKAPWHLIPAVVVADATLPDCPLIYASEG